MMLYAITFPAIDPVALELGPIVIRWYALAYLAAFLLGWRYTAWLATRRGGRPNAQDYSDFLTWIVIGVILGGRLGSVLFYNLPYYLENPLEALMIWQGGMSFHGGFLGVVAAVLLYAGRHGLSPLSLGDPIAAAAPIGLLLGRIANFINGELWGRPSDLPWAVIFPHPLAEGIPRHPSQLYQAGLEGVLLFGLLFLAARRPVILNRPGLLCGLFLIGYGACRMVGELFRQPDFQIGFLAGGLTMGQVLSLPMIGVGLWLAWRVRPGHDG